MKRETAKQIARRLLRESSRWGHSGRLGTVIFLSVREALNAPAHPDSKRQARRKKRDLARYGARILKRAGVVSCPAMKTNKRREFRDMQRRMAEENKRRAQEVADRLLGMHHNLKQVSGRN